jgi:hypothetical protein
MTLLAPPPTTPSVAPAHYQTVGYKASSPYISMSAKIMVDIDAPPTWIADVVRTINELLALGPDWDTYGARPIDPKHVESGLILLQDLAFTDSPMPVVVPTVARGVQFEWETARGAVEARVDDEGSCIYVRDEAGEAESAPTPGLAMRAALVIAPSALVA